MESTMVKNSEKRFGNGASSELAGKGEIFSYGLGGFGRGLLNTVVMGLLNYFYTNSVGMSAAVVGMIFLISRIFDGVSDVIAGTLVDKTNSKYGKTRFWLLLSPIPFAITSVMLFTVPDISMTGKIIYMFITYNLVTTVFGTLWYVPHMTLTSLITRDKNQRTHVSIVNQIFFMVSNLLPILFILPYIKGLGNSQSSWVKAITVIAVVAAICMLTCFFNTRERVQLSQNTKNNSQNKIGFTLMMKTLFKNKYWFMIMGIFVTDALTNNFFSAAGIYYTQYVLGDVSYFGFITMANLIPTMIALFLIAPFVKKMSKGRIFLIGALIKAFGLFLMVILPVSLNSVLIARGIAAFGMGITFSVMYAFVPDTIEYGHWKTGIRLEGVIQSADSFGAKLGVGLAPGVVGLIMAKTGFDGLAAVQTAETLNAVRICALWGPLFFAILMIVIICFYDLDKKYPQIIKELEERKLSAAN